MTERWTFDPATAAPIATYKLLTATVVPRPIAWVSTRSPDGVDNLAPHSFFTVACDDPPIVQFSSVTKKDTLRNVEATGEFVVNLASEPLFEQVNHSSGAFAAGVSEFEAAGVTAESSATVAPPRVAESPVAIEASLHSIVKLGRSYVVFGRVEHIAIHTDVMDLSNPDRPHPRIEQLAPLARLGRDEWSTLGEVRSIARPQV